MLSKNTNFLISIIMPSYNSGEYICKSIDSVLRQTYKNFELIIIDDCSNDNTIEIVSSYKD
ncbi:glycosyltransferase family 2 protein, partial [Proteus columbae]